MKVLLVWHGAAGHRYRERLESLGSSEGIHLDILVPAKWREFRKMIKTGKTKESSYVLETGRTIFNWHGSLYFYLSGLYSLLKRKPDVIHLHEEPWSLCALEVLLLKKLVDPEAVVVVESWQNIRKNFPPPFSWIEKFIFREADGFIAGSNEIAQVLGSKGVRKTMEVIPLATSTELFRPLKDVPEMKKKLNLQGYIVGYVGRLVKEKGLLDLLEAVAKLSGDSLCLLIGEGPLKNELEQKAGELGIAERLHIIPGAAYQDIPYYLNCMDVLVLPSRTTDRWKEQFGRVLVEAMACGVPVVGSDSGEIPHVIDQAGLIFPEGDVEALTGCLQQIRQDRNLREKLIEQGKHRVDTEYTWQVVSQKTVGLYQSLRKEKVLRG